MSPPWGQRIPPLLVNLLERVYVKGLPENKLFPQ
ncbi:DUF1392 family protein [Nostoc commune]